MGILRSSVKKAAEIAGFKRSDISKIILAVDEACTNIIKYAYRGDNTKIIRIKIIPIESGIKFIISDDGKKPDLKKIKARKLDDVRPGGLGVHFISEIMDCVRYKPGKEKGTKLTLIKYVP